MPVFVNKPDRFAALGYSAWREGIRELIAGREILTSLIRRDIAARYRQSLLGIGWAVITPLAMVLVFLFLQNTNRLAAANSATPNALWLYAGLLPWQFFQGSLTRATQSLSAQPGLVGRVRFPREILVLAALGGALFDFVLGSTVLALFFVGTGTIPAWTIIFVPLLLALQLLLSTGIGLLLAVMNGVLRDLGNIVPLAGLLWMFLTPVVYPPASEGPGAVLNWINPMAPIIVAWRDLMLTGSLSMPGPLLVSVLFTLLLVPIAWRFFHVLLPRIAETI